MLHKYTHIPVAVLIYGVDFAVLGCQLSFSDTEQVLYGILTLVTETLVLNRVMVMGASQMQLLVISEAYEEIRQKLIGSLDAGVTMVHIENGYGKTQSRGVLCIVPDRKLFQAKELIQGADPGAFITISKINEVRGRGLYTWTAATGRHNFSLSVHLFFSFVFGLLTLYNFNHKIFCQAHGPVYAAYRRADETRLIWRKQKNGRKYNNSKEENTPGASMSAI